MKKDEESVRVEKPFLYNREPIGNFSRKLALGGDEPSGVGSAISGVSSFIGNVASDIQDSNDINSPAVTADTIDDLLRNSSKSFNLGRVSVGKAIAEGAAGGGSVGTLFGPIGTAIGTAVGAIGGTGAALLMNSSRARNERRLSDEYSRNVVNRAMMINGINSSNMYSNVSADGGKIEVGGKRGYDDWFKTVPKDRNDTTSYNLRRAYELAPMEQLEAWRTSSMDDLINGKNHLGSVYLNPDTGIYEFMKSRSHPTINMELDWYKSNSPDAVDFRNNYDLDTTGEYYRYVPKKDIEKTKAMSNKYSNGGNMDVESQNGVQQINAGGTHEANPNGGVMQGVDGHGIPNLVEQGEVRYGDYIFSNRLVAGKGVTDESGIGSKYSGSTFADIAKKMQKESSERPNDPISLRGLKDSMQRLKSAQEYVKAENRKKEMIREINSLTPEQIMGMSAEGQVQPQEQPAPEENEARTFKLGGNLGGSELFGKALMYLPAISTSIGSTLDALGVTNKPDYSSMNGIVNELDRDSVGKLGDYVSPRYIDMNSVISGLNELANGSRRAVSEGSAGNRATMTAGMLSSDYNYLKSLSDMYQKAYSYNSEQDYRTSEFNRGTNQYNLQNGMSDRAARIQAMEAIANMKSNIDSVSSQSKSANLTSAMQNLGELGKYIMNRNMIDNLARNGVLYRDSNFNYTGNNDGQGGKSYDWLMNLLDSSKQ